MVAVDTIGSSLGKVVNCNLMITKILGFEKQTVMGKNVNRLMPKIFSEIHNSYILEYLKGYTNQEDVGKVIS